MSVYSITSAIQNNVVANRGLMELGGVAIPQAAMANNKTEARERISKSSIFIGVTFLSQFFTIPLMNKASLKAFGVTKSFGGKESQIIQLSNKYLSGNTQEMREGIAKLSEDLKKSKFFKKADLSSFMKIDDKGLDLLRKKLIKSKNGVFALDFLITGVMAGSVPWGVNLMTKKLTKRSGFSAEYAMANSEYTKKNAESYEKSKLKRYLTFVGITSVAAVTIPTLVAKSMLSKKPQGLLQAIKKNSDKFDYTDGIFMKLLPCFLMDSLGACVGEFLSCRDNYERRDLGIRLPFILSVFYGSDAILNNLGGRLIDKLAKTRLIDKNKKSEINKLRSLKEISELKNIDAKTLSKTKKCAVGMYWGNLLISMTTLGFMLPYVLNKMLKSSVKNDLNSNN